jgi:hypothetical protein
MANPNFTLTLTAVQANLTALETSIDAGTAAVIEIYSGTEPANADASGAGLTLLASLTCSATFGSVGGSGTTGTITAGTITSATAVATGTASTFRIKTQTGGTVIAQGDVGTSSASLILNTVSITSGSTVAITSAVISQLVG